jgi:lipoprotein-releasing system ATP-binding protein
MMDTTTILKLENVFKHFYEPEKFQVLNGIDLEVKKGSFVSIVGKSGCGKSTLLYILSTLDTDYTGQLTIAGELLSGKTPDYLAAFRNKYIGFIFQFHYLLPEFTALENVMIPALKLGILSKQEIEANAIALLKQLDLVNFAHRRAGNLSGGQQQRVAIARALVNNPIIIIGDEPTGNLDSENSTLIVDVFKELSRKKQQTIIIVTHDDEVAANTDSIIEMKDGSLTGNLILTER